MRASAPLRMEGLCRAADGLQAALFARRDLSVPLQDFADAAGADGVILMRDNDSVWQEIVHSPAIDEPVKRYLAGQTPPDSRATRVRLTHAKGFLGDFDSFAPEELARDAYYQEFLRGHGMGWHAAACLVDGDRNQTVMSLKRALWRGHYERAELDLLDAVLPRLRATASFAHAFGLAEVAGAARGLDRSGRAYQLDTRLRCAVPDTAATEDAPVQFVDGRPRAARPEEQRAFDAALAAASRRPFAFATLLVHALDGKHRAIVRMAPVVGSAASLFHDVHVILVVTPIGIDREPGKNVTTALTRLFHLTPAEARAAALVGCAWRPREAARRLRVGEGTFRNQLKASFAKIGITRQAHLSQVVTALED